MRTFASWITRHRKTVLFLWIAIFAVSLVAAITVGSDFKEDFKLPKSDSQQAYDMLTKNFPAQSGDSAQIVIHSEKGVNDAAAKARVNTALAKIKTVDGVSNIQSPYGPGGKAFISPDGKTAFATVTWDHPIGKQDLKTQVDPLIAAVKQAQTPGLNVEAGGAPIQASQQSQSGGAEGVGVLAAIVVLLIMFGSVVAMGMPIITALVSVGTASSLIVLSSHIFSTADFATFLSAMIGLGVGIDYALFIVTRFRQGLREGLEPTEAVVVAMDTAGRAVLFAGITVVIALLGLFAIGVSFLYGPAVAASLTVLLTMTAALTLLPAMLTMIGRRIDKLRLPFRKAATAAPAEGQHAHKRWHAWSSFVQRRPWPVALVTTMLLLVLAIPAFSLELGVADAGTDASDTSTRKAYDLLAAGFGSGFNGPLTIVVDAKGGPAQLAEITNKIKSEKGVASVTPAQLSPNKKVAVITAFPTTSPQSKYTKQLVTRLRNDVLAKYNASGTKAHIAGITAIFDDFSTLISSKLPLFIGAVVALSALLLLAVFRSVLIPVKAVVMNLLGILSAFGVTVAVFQWGWGASVIGVDSTAPIIAFLPVMVFAIVFGLSMDYEVFLMSRVHEEWERRNDAKEAVIEGLAATGGVITAAAVIMISLFASFAFLTNDLTTKLFGLALATTVFLDAFVIRSALVPAVMAILGERAWWMPAWLDKLVPRLNVEPPEDLHTDPQTGQSERAEPAPSEA